MTKTKKQLRAEAVERLRKLPIVVTTGNTFVNAMIEKPISCMTMQDVRKELIDLLTDDEYECPSDPGEAGIACVDAFIAEHSNDDSTPEKVVSDSEPFLTPSSSTNGTGNGDDSREKLEEDMAEYLEREWYMLAPGLLDKMGGWLDRQAAITEREWLEGKTHIFGMTFDEVRGLQAKVKELTEERDEAVKAYDAHMAAHDAWHEAEDITYTRNRFSVLEQAKNERIAKLTAERDEYREKFGKALDLAHEIGRLGECAAWDTTSASPARRGSWLSGNSATCNTTRTATHGRM